MKKCCNNCTNMIQATSKCSMHDYINLIHNDIFYCDKHEKKPEIFKGYLGVFLFADVTDISTVGNFTTPCFKTKEEVINHVEKIHIYKNTNYLIVEINQPVTKESTYELI